MLLLSDCWVLCFVSSDAGLRTWRMSVLLTSWILEYSTRWTAVWGVVGGKSNFRGKKKCSNFGKRLGSTFHEFLAYAPCWDNPQAELSCYRRCWSTWNFFAAELRCLSFLCLTFWIKVMGYKVRKLVIKFVSEIYFLIKWFTRLSILCFHFSLNTRKKHPFFLLT